VGTLQAYSAERFYAASIQDDARRVDALFEVGGRRCFDEPQPRCALLRLVVCLPLLSQALRRGARPARQRLLAPLHTHHSGCPLDPPSHARRPPFVPACAPQAAPAAGIGLARASLPLCTLRALLLHGGCLVIALVDKATLDSGACAAVRGCSGGGPWAPGTGQQRACSEGGSSGGCSSCGGGAAASEQRQGSEEEGEAGGGGAVAPYSGHYVVLCGFDAACDEFEMRDPAACRREALPAQLPITPLAAGPRSVAHPALPPLPRHAPLRGCPRCGPAWSGAAAARTAPARGPDAPRRSPARRREQLWLPAARLEAARKCFGTDEDLLLVAVPPREAAAVQAAGTPAAAQAPAAAAAAGPASSGAGDGSSGEGYRVVYG
jgi:hypothetical protein